MKLADVRPLDVSALQLLLVMRREDPQARHPVLGTAEPRSAIESRSTLRPGGELGLVVVGGHASARGLLNGAVVRRRRAAGG